MYYIIFLAHFHCGNFSRNVWIIIKWWDVISISFIGLERRIQIQENAFCENRSDALVQRVFVDNDEASTRIASSKSSQFMSNARKYQKVGPDAFFIRFHTHAVCGTTCCKCLNVYGPIDWACFRPALSYFTGFNSNRRKIVAKNANEASIQSSDHHEAWWNKCCLS